MAAKGRSREKTGTGIRARGNGSIPAFAPFPNAGLFFLERKFLERKGVK